MTSPTLAKAPSFSFRSMFMRDAEPGLTAANNEDTLISDGAEPAASADTLVSFRQVQKSYDGESLVVKNLNLEIRRGEFLTMLGPSGSGKTTSLMMLAGFEVPTSGEIRLDGKLLNNMPPHKRNIGMVFQNYALFPHLTIFENVAFPLKVRNEGFREIRYQVDKALEMVQLDKFAQRYPAQLSGGQQQRVALARALVFKPQLVLMDEPLGALDKQLREHMQMEIKHIHQQLGVTVVYVTHDQSEALTMSDRVAVFNNGIIQQIDKPEMLYERPANSFVANFIGENNRLPGTLVSRDGAQCVVEMPFGEKVIASAVNIGKIGDPVSLSIRPERVVLNDAALAAQNRFNGQIREFIYLGDHVRIRMEVCGTQDFIIKMPTSQFDSRLREGDVVPLGWEAGYAHALDPV